MTLVERFHVNGEPRDADLTDLDGDGWNDAIIVIRDGDKVQAYRNVQGAFVLSAEAPVGKSPREVALADFNHDGCQDFVVVNRQSYDVSLLLGCGADAVGFQQLDQTYPVDGEVAGLEVVDLNNDHHADVIQLHRASSEISVRLADQKGQLSEPQIFPTGLQPNGFDIADVNGDGHLDVLTANLGQGGAPGTISVLLGDGSGSFGSAATVQIPLIPGQPEPRLLAVEAADFDDDDKVDLVTSFADARIAFFRGNGDGSFTAAADYSEGYPAFVFETRQFVTGDFDQDGDIDLAGVGFYGELGVLENHGELLTETELSPTLYGAPELDSQMWYRARELRLHDLNHDQDPDLVIGLDAGLAVFLGTDGAQFLPGQFQSGPGVPPQGTLPEVTFSVSGFAFGDFDTDGDQDLAVACFVDGCLTILTRDEGNTLFREAMKVTVPAADFVAVGDIDGDGKDDLAGSGRTALWVALSGHVPEIRPSGSVQFERQKLPHPVINEVMSSNKGTLLGSAGDRYPDWVELYNPLSEPIDLSGWTLELIKDDQETNSYSFPDGETLPALGRKLILCANNPGPDLLNTGYRLPDSGATLLLRDPAGIPIDIVPYPKQKSDIAYARFADGVASFTSPAMASPGSANVYTGPIPPSLKFRGFDPENFTSDVPLRLFAEADDDSAVLGVSLAWRRVDLLNSPWRRVVFYDDGRHQDGALADGLFSGVIESGLPENSVIQFYLEATDANNRTTYLPEAPDEAEDSGTSRLYVLAFGQSPSPIEISEILSSNQGAFLDENQGTPDYVELRNVFNEPVLMDPYAVVDRSLDPNKRFLFPPGIILQPGEAILVICDSKPSQGPLHADFKISAGGDTLYLQQLTVSGAFLTVDAVEVPPLLPDMSYARVGAKGRWEILAASPDASNLSDNRIRSRMRSLGVAQEFTLTFPVRNGATYYIESSTSIHGPWNVIAAALGTKVAGTFIYTLRENEPRRFFKIRSN